MTKKSAKKAAARAQREMDKRSRLLHQIEKMQGKPQHHEWGEFEYWRSQNRGRAK